jgi:protein-tyrosine-phosphatase
VDRLVKEFSGVFSQETVRRYVWESLDSLGHLRLKEYLHILAGRFARDRLKAAAVSGGFIASDVPTILYVCTHNAGRSQMAAAFTAHLGGRRVSVMSEGSIPASEVNAVVVQAMAEIGIDLSREFPKPVTDEVVQAADVVITMGCGDACPVFPGRRYLDWAVEDPAGQPLAVVRPIRDDVRARVEGLLVDLGVIASATGSASGAG